MQNKLLIFSDSHGFHDDLFKTIKKMRKEITHVMHLGDGFRDYSKCLDIYDNIDFCFVPGNCDFGTNHATIFTLNVNNKKIIMTHGHYFDVKYSYDRICNYAAESSADICLFGHTHTPADFYHKGILMFNPGSISGSREFNCPTYGIINIYDSGKIGYSFIGINNKTHKELYGNGYSE